MHGFLKEFVTPIIKVTGRYGGASSRSFYTIPDYEVWEKERNGDLGGFKIKYYKGLGTSTCAEAKEYFKDLEKHVIYFNKLNRGLG